MKKRALILTALLIAVIMLLSAASVYADFGGFSGDSDYGGSSWGGSDWGGSDWSGSDSGFGFFSFGDDGDGTRSGGGSYLTLLVIIAVIVLIIYVSRGKMQTNTPVQTTVARTDSSLLRPMGEYVAECDGGFSEADMRTKLSNLYVRLQECWCDKDLTPLRPYLTDELYAQSEIQLDAIKKQNRTPHIERISVLGVNIRGWFERDGMDHIIAELNTRISTYTTDDATGETVEGDPMREKFMTYEWDLCRTSGRVTEEEPEMVTVNCPNCGAPVAINKSAKCPYCDSVITLDEHDWVLYSIKGLSQRTA